MKIHLFAFLFFTACFVSCIDEVSLDVDAGQRSLVVDGLLSDSFSVQKIKVSQSAVLGYGNDNILTPVPGCNVHVLDDAGNSYDFPETEPGVYSKEMKGEPGRTYHLEMTTPDGKAIESHPAVLQKAPAIGTITPKVVVEDVFNQFGNLKKEERVVLHVNTSVADFTERPYLRWRADGEYEFHEMVSITSKICYVKNRVDLNNLAIFDTHQLAGDSIFDQPIINTVLDGRFADNYCFHVFQYAISKEEYKYWQAVDDILNVDGSLFDPPPGTVRGNLFNVNDPTETVVGYFSVAGVSYRRKFVKPETLGMIYIEHKCDQGFRNPYPECSNCLLLGASTLNRPVYWEP